MTTYNLAQYSWDDAEVITVSSNDDQIIGTFPLDFLRRCGVNVWEYICEIVIQLVEEEGEAVGSIHKPDGALVCTTDILQPGDYCYLPANGQPRVVFAKGPEYFRRNIPPSPDGSQSTRSDSKRSTARQSDFRVALIARDYECLVTEAPYAECTACHIVPQSRPDIYQHLLAIRYPAPMFSVSAGLLLRDDIHHAFDRLELSFYFKNGKYYLHYFVLRTRTDRELHGKVLDSQRFRGTSRNHPEPRFIRWHYNQCIKARIRGFAVAMQ